MLGIPDSSAVSNSDDAAVMRLANCLPLKGFTSPSSDKEESASSACLLETLSLTFKLPEL
jgi:hypothetical protein